MYVKTSMRAIIFILACSIFGLQWHIERNTLLDETIPQAAPVICCIIFLPLLWTSFEQTSINRGVELYFCIVGCILLFIYGGTRIYSSLYISSRRWNWDEVTAQGYLAVIAGFFSFGLGGYIVYSRCSKSPHQNVQNSYERKY